jgi:hypothetical protein
LTSLLPNFSGYEKSHNPVKELWQSAVLFPFPAPVQALWHRWFIPRPIPLRKRQSLQNTVNLNRFHIMLGMAILADCFPDFLYRTHFNPFLSQ